MLFSVEIIEASAPSVTCVISRVEALNPAAQTTFGLMEKYEPNRYAREFGPPVGGDGDGPQPYLPFDYKVLQIELVYR